MNKKIFVIIFTLTILILGCDIKTEEEKKEDECLGRKGTGVASLLISPQQDVEMGLATVEQIESNPTEFPILDSAQYHVAYGHIYRITNNILNSGKVAYKDDFVWRVRIIRDDNTLNAFCTPGGYIYVYTGIIKFLDNETQLAGVMGHEIAHADRRHSAKQMIQVLGLQTLIEILTSGTTQQLATLGANILALKFSRNDETEADNYSVIYLLNTEYNAQGAKYFFDKIKSADENALTEFLSTHPNPTDRVTNIEKTHECLGGGGNTGTFEQRYAQFKSSLP
jgi:predicted Zn-dependent protease